MNSSALCISLPFLDLVASLFFMRDLFVVSDTHFNHENILKFVGSDGKRFRPFDSVLEMNECMVDRWNSIVKPQDSVYHLGDVYLTHSASANELLKRLNGRKRLILGNHDSGKDGVFLKHFEKILMWRTRPDFGLIFSHVPLHPSSMFAHRAGKQLVNVHGHIHQNNSPPGPYINVCVEQTNWSPVPVEVLIQQAEKLL